MVTMPAAAPCSSTTSACWRLTHLVQHVERLGGLREREHVAGQLGDRPVALVEQVAQVDDADDVVEVAVVGHGRPRVPARRQLPQPSRGRPVAVEDEHVGAGAQHLVERALGDLEGAVEDQALHGGEGRLATDHLPELGLGDRLPLHVRVSAQQPHGQVGRPGQQPDGGARDRREQPQRAGGDQRPTLGPLHGDPLGRQLAEHERDVREQERHDDDRRRPGDVAEERQRLLQRLGQRDGGGRRGQEPGQRDADLDRGQEVVGVARQANDQRTRGRSLLELSQLPLPQRHERHLGARERGVEQHEDGHQRQLGPGAAHGLLPGSGGGCEGRLTVGWPW